MPDSYKGVPETVQVILLSRIAKHCIKMKSMLILLLLVSVAVTVSVARKPGKVSSLSFERKVFNQADRSQLK